MGLILTNGRKPQFVLVDDDDVETLSQYKWYINDNGYAYRAEKGENGKLRTVRMHRQITGAPRHLDVDHINGDRADNRRLNLRTCDRSSNLKNKTRKRRDNSSGVTGVYLHKQTGKWTAQIQVGGKPRHLGLFQTKDEAGAARRAAEIQYYGEFAPRRKAR